MVAMHGSPKPQPQKNNDSSIAIIAMVGRFPGAGNIEEFWHNLRNAIESISRFGPGDFEPGGSSSRWVGAPNFVMAHGVLQGVEYFDHHFFDYSPAEAELIDPQQRLFLEQAYAALEVAGYDPDTYPGLIGVYAGISTNTYLYNNIYPSNGSPDSTQQFQIMVANDKDYLSTRVSYKLNLKGPSYTIQTACSTSLVAVHAACQSLLTGECDIALAGGVTVKVPQVNGYLYEEGMIFSRDGRVRSFDAAASGTVLGNGIGIVVLKPLEAALEDRDTIHAVIRGSATNNDGSFKASYAAPSKEGQFRVILEAHAMAGVDADSITYVEAHATGTLLGDPVEVSALTQAFRKSTATSGFCAIGSVKSNVGHLDSAAGVAGLIKTALMLENRQLVATVNFATANPNIDFRNSPFYVSDRLNDWTTTAEPRRAAVSSFGVGGTNAHVVLEEAPSQRPSGASSRSQLVVLSAKTPAALEQMGKNLDRYLQLNPSVNLADVAYTSSAGRRAYKHRRAVVIRSSDPVTLTQSAVADLSGEVSAVEPSIAFVFPELQLTDQHVFLAGDLFASQAAFRERVHECYRLLAGERQLDPLAALASDASSQNEPLAAFVFFYSFAAFWMSLGIRPNAVMGKGLGELVAAVIADAVPLHQALQLMDAGVQSVASFARRIVVKSPTIPLATCVTGGWATGELMRDPQYWVDALSPEKEAAAPYRMLYESEHHAFLAMGSREDFPELPPENTSAAPGRLMTVFGGTGAAPERSTGLSEDVVVCLAKLWLRGVAVDWVSYYAGEERRRVALPTYPFSKHRHWLDRRAAQPAALRSFIHPLVHRNVSSFQRQRFVSQFSGDEFFFADHVVAGKRMMPGVAYLEMVRVAADIAMDRGAEASTPLVMRNVVWMSPLTMDQADRDVSVELRRNGAGPVEYAISSCERGAAGKEEVHSQGLVEFRTLQQAAALNLAALRADTSSSCIEQAQFYQRFSALGLAYGSTHRSVRRIHVGHSQVLAEIGLPKEFDQGPMEFGLHPSLMDAALQATTVISGDNDRYDGAAGHSLPFELRELEIFGPCANAAYAWVRPSKMARDLVPERRGETSRKLDIDLCDSSGAICVRMKGFSARRPMHRQARIFTPEQRGLTCYVPVWNPLPAAGKRRSGVTGSRVLAIGVSAQQRESLLQVFEAVNCILLGEDESVAAIAEKLAQHTFDHLLWIAPKAAAKSAADEALLRDQHAGVVQVFRIVKALLSLGYASRDLQYTLITRKAQQVFHDDHIEPSHAGVHGLAGSLAKEYEHWKVRLFDLDSATGWPIPGMFRDIDSHETTLAYRNGEWFTQQLVCAESLPSAQADYRVGGVYVIVGGAGGIGEVLSRYLAQRYLANIIWIGRREIDDSIRDKIDSFPRSGPTPYYVTADATDYESLAGAYRKIKQKHSRIDGVIHSAIVLADKSLAHMAEREFLAALSAKIAVSLRIAQVFGREKLDFVLFFSSIQSFTRSPGQSNYAAGCVFKDAFARRLSREWSCTVKTVNWSFWGGIGVVDKVEYRDRMARAGIGSIEAEEGMAALTQFMGSSLAQIVLFKGSSLQALNAVSAEGSYTAYPADVPSVIEALRQAD